MKKGIIVRSMVSITCPIHPSKHRHLGTKYAFLASCRGVEGSREVPGDFRMSFGTVAILGPGLIGGSLALA